MKVDKAKRGTDQYSRDFIDKFNSLCATRSPWQVWTDFVNVCACALANSVESNEKIKADREVLYEICINQLGGLEIPSEMFALITMALDENPEQDFLGNIFMRLDLGSNWHGQFFTPYSVCQFMSELNVDAAQRQIEEKGYITK